MLSHTRPYRAIPMKWQLFRKEAIFRGAQFAYGFMWLFFLPHAPSFTACSQGTCSSTGAPNTFCVSTRPSTSSVSSVVAPNLTWNCGTRDSHRLVAAFNMDLHQGQGKPFNHLKPQD